MQNYSIGFLGPAGSYSELALKKALPGKEISACRSIREVFIKVESGELTCGFVPVENVIQGPVTSTLDLLLQYYQSIEIVDSSAYPIRHSIGILGKSNIEMDQLGEVYSHPQALDQCSTFLLNNLPAAERLPMASTSAATQYINKRSLMNSAAIAPAETLKSAGFRVLKTDISDHPNNQTRFVLICKRDITQRPAIRVPKSEDTSVTSLVICPGRDRNGLLYEVLEVVSIAYGVNILSIHSRPDTRGGFVFYLDLEGHESESSIQNCLIELDKYTREATGHTAKIAVFGSYTRTPFYRPAFSSVGVIGGNGEMGRWFVDFFTEAGIETYISDKKDSSDSSLSLKELAKRSDVIILSVPMSAIESVIKKLTPHLKPGHLVIENCSIKNSSLPIITAATGNSIEVLGLHTMFGGAVKSIKGENIILTRTTKSGKKAQAFEDLFYKHGAKVSHATQSEHDRATSYVQSLTHLVLICLAEVLKENFTDEEQLEAFNTPNSRALISAMKRVLNQQDDLLIDIQLKNDQAQNLRRRFLEQFFNLSASLEQGEKNKLFTTLSQTRGFFQKPSQ